LSDIELARLRSFVGGVVHPTTTSTLSLIQSYSDVSCCLPFGVILILIIGMFFCVLYVILRR
jgi:hypothetical protein